MEDKFKILNEFFNKKEKEEEEKKGECCSYPSIIFNSDTYENVCENCGSIIKRDYTEEIKPIKEDIYMNEVFTGMIKGRDNLKLKRTMLYNNSQITYKKTRLNTCHRDMDKIFKELNISSKPLIEKAKLYYKKIYLYEDTIRTRGNIKYGIYYYCILISIIQEGYNYNIINIFKDLDYIDIFHYNKAIDKLNPDFYELLYIDKDIQEYIDIINKLKLNIDTIELIKHYNKYLSKNIKLNNTTILKGCIYQLLLKNEGLENGFDKLFISHFNTSIYTLNKFKNIAKTIII